MNVENNPCIYLLIVLTASC